MSFASTKLHISPLQIKVFVNINVGEKKHVLQQYRFFCCDWKMIICMMHIMNPQTPLFSCSASDHCCCCEQSFSESPQRILSQHWCFSCLFLDSKLPNYYSPNVNRLEEPVEPLPFLPRPFTCLSCTDYFFPCDANHVMAVGSLFFFHFIFTISIISTVISLDNLLIS